MNIEELNLENLSSEEQSVFLPLLQRMQEGNRRFRENNLIMHDKKEIYEIIDYRRKPYAIILTCAQLQVSPNIIFDEIPGSFFVVQTAGNLINKNVLASIEFSIMQFKPKIFMILGHDNCGAVNAALSYYYGKNIEYQKNKDFKNIYNLMKQITPAIKDKHDVVMTQTDKLNHCISSNVRLQMKNAIERSKIIAQRVESKEIFLFGGVFKNNIHRINMIPYTLES